MVVLRVATKGCFGRQASAGGSSPSRDGMEASMDVATFPMWSKSIMEHGCHGECFVDLEKQRIRGYGHERGFGRYFIGTMTEAASGAIPRGTGLRSNVAYLGYSRVRSGTSGCCGRGSAMAPAPSILQYEGTYEHWAGGS